MAVWQRHPRYSLLTFVVLVTTFYLLVPRSTSPPSEPFAAFTRPEGTLENVMKRSHQIYDKMLVQRKALIKKWGPEPKDVQTFPADVWPWPPYTVWDFFPASFNCPHEIQRLGALGDGGKWVCGLTRLAEKKDCVVYSFGINKESSFEAEIVQGTKHCQVYGFDFSVDGFGPEIPREQQHRTHFKPYGLAGRDLTGPDAEHPMYTLDSLMKMNGHTFIDILKVDIESWEFETLTQLVEVYGQSGKPLPFGQLQLEIHIWGKSFEEFLKWWEGFENLGLRPFWTEPNLVYQNYHKEHSDLAEYSFLNTRGDNVFIKDLPLDG